ncbi:hypothetical protein [Mycobacteroides abscessus]|uniref:Ribbon-helix-helix, copG family protein n=1 Tax=Mycobacteroides abscessus MAB_091912_2446 TaxID=1335414 RepID=A0A829MDL6_9MYCO|nr:hypothetical protein [Mycobacteroides abscessus]ESV58918.1 ribbon-helix-helix, copG family protein [Mycobacteroides abscessus MAB_082312_2258]ESV62302.1 ribbon-helix-helix, copG family protein [Mycobacteroides abscessus MAB_091912_2446]QSM04465.1 antitoxin [Mycobacterium phage prophiGD02-2]QST87335.1 antitoxin [Mycobacterium phage prophiGD90-1]AWG55564.1 hypothetical protein DDT53_15935 [Mycobacteroides abscessus]
MTEKDLAALIEAEGEAIEANPDAPITDETKVTRGHPKTRTLQVRLSPEEYEGLEKIADERGLPVSTVAREQLQHLLRASQRSESASRVVSAFEDFMSDIEFRVRRAPAGITEVTNALREQGITIAPAPFANMAHVPSSYEVVREGPTEMK